MSEIQEINGNYLNWDKIIDNNRWDRPPNQDDLLYKEQFRIVERRRTKTYLILDETGWDGYSEQPIKVVFEGSKKKATAFFNEQLRRE